MEYEHWLLNLIGTNDCLESMELETLNYLRLFESLEPIHTKTSWANARTNVRGSKAIELDYGIMEFLAVQGSNTPYKIAKVLKIRESSLSNAIARLQKYGFVRVRSKERWRTGLPRKLFSLTSLGLAAVLAYQPRKTKTHDESGLELSFEISPSSFQRYPQLRKWFVENVDDDELLNRIIRNNSQLPIYNLIFRKWRELEKSTMLNEILAPFEEKTGIIFQDRIIFNPQFNFVLFKEIIREISQFWYLVSHDKSISSEDNDELDEIFHDYKMRIYGHLARLLVYSVLESPLPGYGPYSEAAVFYVMPKLLVGHIWGCEGLCSFVKILLEDLYMPFLASFSKEQEQTLFKLEFFDSLRISINSIITKRPSMFYV